MATLLLRCPSCVHVTDEKTVRVPDGVNSESELLDHYAGVTTICSQCGADMEPYDAEM